MKRIDNVLEIGLGQNWGYKPSPSTDFETNTAMDFSFRIENNKVYLQKNGINQETIYYDFNKNLTYEIKFHKKLETNYEWSIVNNGEFITATRNGTTSFNLENA